jgi:hypothetical protein
MAKPKMRKNVRVVLKKNKASDGVIAEPIGKGSWKVKWSTGPHAGTVTTQSSMSLTFWTALDAPPSEDEEDEEAGSDGAPSDEDVDSGAEEYVAKKARFDKYRKTLVGKTVEVHDSCYHQPT